MKVLGDKSNFMNDGQIGHTQNLWEIVPEYKVKLDKVLFEHFWAHFTEQSILAEGDLDILKAGKHCHINSSVFQLLTTGRACPSSHHLLPRLMYTQKNRKFSARPISPQETCPRVNALSGLAV